MNALGKKKSADAWHQVNDEHRPPRRVRGLWRRYEIFYANLYANDGKQYFYPLHGAITVPEAISKRQALKDFQRGGQLAPPRQIAADEAETLRKKLHETETDEEGCLSLQEVRVPVERPKRIRLEGVDPAGSRLVFELEGLGARVALVSVGVMLARELAVGLLDLIGGRFLVAPERLVVVRSRRHRGLRP